MEIYSKSVEETELIGEKIGKSIKKPCFVALYGDLGAGKTAFTRGFARGFSGYEGVTSPTFAIMNQYDDLYHFDMYRITSEDDLYSIGFYDLSNSSIICEWSENIPFAIPEDAIKITLNYIDEETRKITIRGEIIIEDIRG